MLSNKTLSTWVLLLEIYLSDFTDIVLILKLENWMCKSSF